MLRAPVDKWDEAVPLGNGLLGGLLWGEGQTIRLSLDRGDLWDLRTPAAIHEKGFTYANLQKLVREQNVGEISRLTDAPYNHPTPTKLPAGRLEIVLDPARTVTSFELDLARAEGRVRLSDGTSLVAFFSAVQPVALIRIPGAAPREIRLRIPGSGAGGDTGPDSHAVAALGYPPAKTGSDGGHPLVRAGHRGRAELLRLCPEPSPGRGDPDRRDGDLDGRRPRPARPGPSTSRPRIEVDLCRCT